MDRSNDKWQNKQIDICECAMRWSRVKTQDTTAIVFGMALFMAETASASNHILGYNWMEQLRMRCDEKDELFFQVRH